MDKQLELTGISRVRRRLSTEPPVALIEEAEVAREAWERLDSMEPKPHRPKEELSSWFPLGLNPPCSGMWNIRWRQGRRMAFFFSREWYELNKGWKLGEYHPALTTRTLEWQGLANPPTFAPPIARPRNILIGQS